MVITNADNNGVIKKLSTKGHMSINNPPQNYQLRQQFTQISITHFTKSHRANLKIYWLFRHNYPENQTLWRQNCGNYEKYYEALQAKNGGDVLGKLERKFESGAIYAKFGLVFLINA